eukprot:scaffold112854_cov63-Phaeocystis_antarctica.AAC.2
MSWSLMTSFALKPKKGACSGATLGSSASTFITSWKAVSASMAIARSGTTCTLASCSLAGENADEPGPRTSMPESIRSCCSRAQSCVL